MARRPKQSDQLADLLAGAIGAGYLYDFLAKGIGACIENAASLRTDVAVLLSGERYAAAQFMYTTAFEEIGKALILFDVVRANAARSGGYRKLCGSFYNHLQKFGYANTVLHPGVAGLMGALQAFRAELIEYYPSHAEDGEPGEYAEGLANREWAVYVDCSVWGGWSTPQHSSYARWLGGAFPEPRESPAQSELDLLLPPFERAQREGLFSPTGLRLVEAELGPRFITAGGERKLELGIRALDRRSRKSGITLSAETLASNLVGYPLYAVLIHPKQVPSWSEYHS